MKLGGLHACGEHTSIEPLLSSLVGPGCAQSILEGYIAMPLGEVIVLSQLLALLYSVILLHLYSDTFHYSKYSQDHCHNNPGALKRYFIAKHD